MAAAATSPTPFLPCEPCYRVDLADLRAQKPCHAAQAAGRQGVESEAAVEELTLPTIVRLDDARISPYDAQVPAVAAEAAAGFRFSGATFQCVEIRKECLDMPVPRTRPGQWLNEAMWGLDVASKPTIIVTVLSVEGNIATVTPLVPARALPEAHVWRRPADLLVCIDAAASAYITTRIAGADVLNEVHVEFESPEATAKDKRRSANGLAATAEPTIGTLDCPPSPLVKYSCEYGYDAMTNVLYPIVERGEFGLRFRRLVKPPRGNTNALFSWTTRSGVHCHACKRVVLTASMRECGHRFCLTCAPDTEVCPSCNGFCFCRDCTGQANRMVSKLYPPRPETVVSWLNWLNTQSQIDPDRQEYHCYSCGYSIVLGGIACMCCGDCFHGMCFQGVTDITSRPAKRLRDASAVPLTAAPLLLPPTCIVGLKIAVSARPLDWSELQDAASRKCLATVGWPGTIDSYDPHTGLHKVVFMPNDTGRVAWEDEWFDFTTFCNRLMLLFDDPGATIGAQLVDDRSVLLLPRDPVYCICRGPDDGRPMVLCEGCEEWYHLDCVGRTNDNMPDGKYVCSFCKTCDMQKCVPWPSGVRFAEPKSDMEPVPLGDMVELLMESVLGDRAMRPMCMQCCSQLISTAVVVLQQRHRKYMLPGVLSNVGFWRPSRHHGNVFQRHLPHLVVQNMCSVKRLDQYDSPMRTFYPADYWNARGLRRKLVMDVEDDKLPAARPAPGWALQLCQLLDDSRKQCFSSTHLDDRIACARTADCTRLLQAMRHERSQRRGLARLAQADSSPEDSEEESSTPTGRRPNKTARDRGAARRSRTTSTTAPGMLAALKQLQPKKVALGRSAIHAWGVFASEHIYPNDIVVEYVGQVIRDVVADKREKQYAAEQLGSDYMFRLGADEIIDATKAGSVARYINHSCNPNCYSHIVVHGGTRRVVIVAKEHIKPGEELCYDYKFPIEKDKIPCNCGAPNCRRTMN